MLGSTPRCNLDEPDEFDHDHPGVTRGLDQRGYPRLYGGSPFCRRDLVANLQLGHALPHYFAIGENTTQTQ